MIRSRIAVAAACLALAACSFDATGIEEASDYAGEMVTAAVVTSVECSTQLTVVGGTGRCVAYNQDGANIQLEGQALVRWGVDNTSILNIDLNGKFTARASGSAIITARGARGSFLQTQITVQ